MVKVKICGLTRHEDVEAAMVSDADAVGFVRHAQSPRYVSKEEALGLGAHVGPFVARFLVHVRDGGADDVPGFIVQAQTFARNLNELGSRRVLVLPVAPDTRVDDLLASALAAPLGTEAYLLDTSVGGRTGGSGRSFDWGVAEEFVAKSTLPTILAGGLNPNNVASAVLRVRPYAVDVSSGVETSPGVKDAVKVRDFVQAAKGVSAT